MKIQKKINWLLLLIMMISMSGMLYFGSQKEGYHVDELYSYGLANSEYLPFMHFGENGYDVKDWMLEYGAGESFGDLFRNLSKDFKILKEHGFRFYDTPIYQAYRIAQQNSADTRTSTWVSGQDYRDYLAASDSNTFNYASVYYNQRGDVHPPFYYILLHTICSFFPGTFSKWFGLSLNIIFMMAAIWLVHRMLTQYLCEEKVALAVAAVYGLSCGFFTCAVFLRMYAVLTFMVLLMCYIHLKISSEDFLFSKKNVVWLILATFFGYYTHYYFVIYAIAIAFIFSIWLCVRKKWKSLIKYILILGSTAVAGVCIWPFSVKHVFNGYRGVDSLNTIMSGEFHWIKIRLILGQIFGQLFDGIWWIPGAAALVVVVCLVLKKCGRFDLWKALVVFVPVMVYIAAVAQIVPFYVDRYVMCTYPFWCILAVLGVWYLVQFIPLKDSAKCGVFIGATALFILLNNGFMNAPGYLGQGGQETYTVPDNTYCVYVLPDGTWNESAEDTLMLSKCEKVAVIYQSDLPVLSDTYEYSEDDCIMVVVHKALSENDVVSQVKDVLEIADMEESFREEAYNTMRIYFQ